MKAVIMAGGKGKRISSIASDIPKPMIKIEGKPILEHEILCLKEQGFTDIIITVSYLSEIIMDYFNNGKELGVNIEYFVEEKPLGNAGALYEIKDKLTDDFLLLNADSIFSVDINKIIKFHKDNNALASILTHPSSHPYDCGLISVDENKIVTNWYTKEDDRPIYYENKVNAGLHIINKKILNDRPSTEKVDLDRQILKPLIKSKRLFAYNSFEYIKDMGTPERYEKVCRDFREKLVEKKNINNKQKAIFLDRDGTINKYVGFLKDINDFELIEGVSQAIKLINDSEYLVIVVTNQPVVARGEVSFEDLKMIHNKMETLLGNDGAYIDGIYVCPHHPDSGFPNEIKELKIDCDCRKPKPGLLFKASKEYNIDLSSSWMIGDSENDILAGKNAGCKTVLIGNDDYKQDITSNNILDAVSIILKK